MLSLPRYFIFSSVEYVVYSSLTGDCWSVGVDLCRVFLNLCVDVICLQCLQIRIPAAQCSHWSICPHSGWYTCLAVAYSVAAVAIMIQTMEIKHCALLEATLDAMRD